MIWIALPIALTYVAACGYLYVRQRDLTYCPQLTRVGAEQTDFSLSQDGVTLRGWVVNPGHRRALIYFGGNAESIQDHRDTFAQWFPNHTAYLVAYRGFGASDGEPSEQALFSDALALFDTVRARHPRAGVDVIGRSLGTGVASHVAGHRPVRRLALVTPFDTLVDVGQQYYPWLPVKLIARERFDSVTYLSQYAGPLLVVQAGRDVVVPPANTRRLVASIGRPAKVLDLPEADHSNVGADPVFRQTLTHFFTRR